MTKKRLTSLLLFFIALAGLALMLYPIVADFWNTRHTSQLISGYDSTIESIDEEQYTEFWAQAQAYNEALSRIRGHKLPDSLKETYETVLDVSGLGIMGYVEIPKMGVSLPIYHGTDPAVLQVGIGHVEWSYLPIGGESTHCVLSGHRGLTSAKLFSDLPIMQIGDVFYIRVLNELLTYQVDQISTVKPRDVDDLEVTEGKDYCSLVTCTPYGVNSHRLIVRGHRIANAEEVKNVLITSEAIRIDPMVVSAVLFSFLILVLIIYLFIITGLKRPEKKE